MAFVLSRCPPFLSPHPSFPTENVAIFPKLPFQTRRTRNSVQFLLRSAFNPRSLSATDQDVIDAVAAESGEKSLPCVRTFENDLARLTLVGAVDFEQALTAAAADGGQSAADHIASGLDAMVVETVFPGPADEHSTVSTRLFLPAKKVKEKAKKLKSTLTEDILSSTSSNNILSMTFRQVVLQQLWNFELALFRPGTERNMEDLENTRQVSPSFTLSSSDERVISVLAEVVCLSALESTKRHFFVNNLGRASPNFLHSFHKRKRIISNDSSVVLFALLEDEVIPNAKSILEIFNSKKTNRPSETNFKHSWWTSSASFKLENIGGSEFSGWVNEYIPAYRLQIDFDKLRHVKLEGWKESMDNKWEVLLTHSQMVGLANILDMYYEDLFTLPGKQLSCGVVAESAKFSVSKGSNSLLKLLSVTLVSGFFMVAISILGWICLPYLLHRRKYPQNHLPQAPVVEHVPQESSELEAFSISIVEKVKNSVGWPGKIMKETGSIAWTGTLPLCVRVGESDCNGIDNSSVPTSLGQIDEEMKASAQDIARYEVIVSGDGEIVGFQPTNRVAVNYWAANTLAKELYGGRKISPGLIELGLKIRHPERVFVLELLMSVNPESFFVLTRPVELSLGKIGNED